MVSSKVRQPRHNVFVARNLLLTICNEKHLFQTNQVNFWIIQNFSKQSLCIHDENMKRFSCALESTKRGGSCINNCNTRAPVLVVIYTCNKYPVKSRDKSNYQKKSLGRQSDQLKCISESFFAKFLGLTSHLLALTPADAMFINFVREVSRFIRRIDDGNLTSDNNTNSNSELLMRKQGKGRMLTQIL